MASATPPELTPVQQRTLAELGASSTARPTFDPELGRRLRHDLEEGMAEVVGHLAPDEVLTLSKHLLGQVHGCEGRLLAEEAAGDGFAVTVAIARGAVAHKAVELGIHWSGEPLPLELVDEAMASLARTDHWLTEFLQTCSDVERAELRATAGDRVHKFFECFPRLEPKWRPVTESSQVVELADGHVRLRGKVDLTLGAARGTQAGASRTIPPPASSARSMALVALDQHALTTEAVNDTLGVLLKYQDDIEQLKGAEVARLLAEL